MCQQPTLEEKIEALEKGGYLLLSYNDETSDRETED